MSASCDKGTEGCTNSNACNYDDSAAINDNSCWFASDGCFCYNPIGSTADCLGVCDADDSNNPPESENGSCDSTVVGGCVDELNCKYDEDEPATHNDGSCASDQSIFGGLSDGTDCNGDCGGIAVEDECDLCIGGTTNYGQCWQIEIKSIVTFKLDNEDSMGSDTNSIIIGTSRNSLDGFNASLDDENPDCELNYSDAPALIKSEMNTNNNNFINYFIPHYGDEGWDEWWGSDFYFNRDIRKNDYFSIFSDNKGMNWFSVIEPTLNDTLISDGNGNFNTYKTIMDSIKFQITHLEGIQCSNVKIYLDREKGESEGGIEYLVENNKVGIKVDTDKTFSVMINISNICIQEIEESCPDDF